MDRDDDMIVTGKRHEFLADYDVGFDADGRILAISIMMASRCGYSLDLSAAVTDRVRVFLVGTAIVRGTGVESPVDARFGIGAGHDAISIGQPASSWRRFEYSSAFIGPTSRRV